MKAQLLTVSRLAVGRRLEACGCAAALRLTKAPEERPALAST